MDKTERQLNLIALLMSAERPKTLDQINDALYADQPSAEASKRMFERDKEELRALGVAIEISPIGAWDEGYVVRRDQTVLPDLGLTPAEHAALMLAAEAWGDGTLGPSSPRMAGMKLAAAAGEPAPAPWILPHFDLRSPNLGPLTEAILRRKVVRFRYRRQGATEGAERIVEPHALTFRSAWYLSGFDQERSEQRSFKLDRIEGTVTVGPGAKPEFESPPPRTLPWPPVESEAEASVAVDETVAWWAERRPGARRTGTLPDGRVQLAIAVPDEGRFVRWAAGLGDAAEVLSPAALRAAVADHLRSVAEGGG